MFEEYEAYLNEQIITYIGNKRSLLAFIHEAVTQVKKELGKTKLVSADIFSGSGIVARHLKGHSSFLLANDLEGYAQTINKCYLSNSSERDMEVLGREYEKLCKSLEGQLTSGFISQMYAPSDGQSIRAGERVFYTDRNARYIDSARQEIAKLDKEIQHFFLAPLLYEASVKTNTSGVFKGFYKNSATGIGQFGGNGKNALARILADINLPFPVFSRYDCQIDIRKESAEQVAKDIRGFDLVYIDPPYNQHPYGSNYFMLNLINDYQRPVDISAVSGIPKDWNRSKLNSKKGALETLGEICSDLGSKYILISFNSEGFVSKEEMEGMLRSLGGLQVFEQKYNTFKGSRNLSNRNIHIKEYLYLLKKA